MKTRRNYVLASLAIVTGIGTAVASAFAPPINPSVRVKLTSGSAFTCQPSGASCESPGAFTCRVHVVVTKSGSSVTTTINGHPVADCPTVLTSSSSTIQPTSLIVFDATN